MIIEIIIAGLVVLLILAFSVRIIRPLERGVLERFGKFMSTRDAGLHLIIPLVDRMVIINITEQMVDVPSQMVITKDKLNTEVDAMVYYRVSNVKDSIYNVDDHRAQITSLARTTLRAVIGKMTLSAVNEERDSINSKVEAILTKETKIYGVSILRVELQKIDPPKDVQDAMNKVVKAEQEKISAKDIATAKETEADGFKRAEIKKAEGQKKYDVLIAEGMARAKVLVAEAEAKKIKLVNEALDKHFVGNAVEFVKLDTFQTAFKDTTKFVIDPNSNVVNVMSNMAGVVPIPSKSKPKSKGMPASRIK